MVFDDDDDNHDNEHSEWNGNVIILIVIFAVVHVAWTLKGERTRDEARSSVI